MNQVRRLSGWMLLVVWIALVAVPGLAGRVAAPEPPDAPTGAFLGVHLKEETEHPEGGARVVGVVPDSPADQAGLVEGDIVVGFDGNVIRGPLALTERIHSRTSGDRVELDIVRDGDRRQVAVELGERSWSVFVPLGDEGLHILDRLPEFDAESWTVAPEGLSEHLGKVGERLGEIYGDPDYWQEHGKGFAPHLDFRFNRKPRLGVQLVETTLELRRHLGGSESEGVLVSKVLAGTPAAASGVKVGDLIVSVDGEPVASPAALVSALEGTEGRTISVGIVRGKQRKTLEVAIPDPEEEYDRPSGPRA